MRVRPADLVAFVERLAEKQALERLARTLSDPRVWAESLEESPELKARLLAEEHEPGTFGAFLKDGLIAAEEKREAKNVVDLHVRPKR